MYHLLCDTYLLSVLCKYALTLTTRLWDYYYPYFMDEETEAQRSKAAWSKASLVILCLLFLFEFYVHIYRFMHQFEQKENYYVTL